jgi:hypothetical protein
MGPDQANELATRICDGIVAAMSAPARPALLTWRMIDQYPPDEIREQIARRFRSLRHEENNNLIALIGWEIVYSHGTRLPDDIVR